MSQFEEGVTLDRYLMETLRNHPRATGQFVDLVQSIALAGKMISARVNKAGLAGMFGGTGDVNVQGEFVQKLDRYANETFLRALEHRGHTCMVVSEEDELPTLIPEQWHSGRYVVTVDPLDGSSNIDCNATIGTIFGIFRRKSPEGQVAETSDVLRPGHELAAAGYIVYGAGTVLVIASEYGVHGFTLDPTVGEFFLSHPAIQIPRSKTWSCNDAYADQWAPEIRTFIQEKRTQGYGARYIGSLVADFHRNLLKGGVFFYPGTPKSPDGKLRLLYEAIPLAYIAERAGGAATDGRNRILDLTPTQLHQRVPLFIGSKPDVDDLTARLTSSQG